MALWSLTVMMALWSLTDGAMVTDRWRYGPDSHDRAMVLTAMMTLWSLIAMRALWSLTDDAMVTDSHDGAMDTDAARF